MNRAFLMVQNKRTNENCSVCLAGEGLQARLHTHKCCLCVYGEKGEEEEANL